MPERYRRRGVRDPMPMELRVEVSVVEIAGYNNKHRFITCTHALAHVQNGCVCAYGNVQYEILYTSSAYRPMNVR